MRMRHGDGSLDHAAELGVDRMRIAIGGQGARRVNFVLDEVPGAPHGFEV
jgi:hypothetical protein